MKLSRTNIKWVEIAFYLSVGLITFVILGTFNTHYCIDWQGGKIYRCSQIEFMLKHRIKLL